MLSAYCVAFELAENRVYSSFILIKHVSGEPGSIMHSSNMVPPGHGNTASM